VLAGAGRRMAQSPSETPCGSRGSRDGAGGVRGGLVSGARRQQCTCAGGAVGGREGDGSGALGVECRAAAAAAVGWDAESFTACECDGRSGGRRGAAAEVDGRCRAVKSQERQKAGATRWGGQVVVRVTESCRVVFLPCEERLGALGEEQERRLGPSENARPMWRAGEQESRRREKESSGQQSSRAAGQQGSRATVVDKQSRKVEGSVQRERKQIAEGAVSDAPKDRTGLARRLCRRSALSRRCSVHYHYHLPPAQSSAQTLRCRDAAASGSAASALSAAPVVVLLQLAFPADGVHGLGSRLGQLRLHATATATATTSSPPRCRSLEAEISNHHSAHLGTLPCRDSA
jgi:hypothetical protein